jgi:hypothetical protein
MFCDVVELTVLPARSPAQAPRPGGSRVVGEFGDGLPQALDTASANHDDAVLIGGSSHAIGADLSRQLLSCVGKLRRLSPSSGKDLGARSCLLRGKLRTTGPAGWRSALDVASCGRLGPLVLGSGGRVSSWRSRGARSWLSPTRGTATGTTIGPSSHFAAKNTIAQRLQNRRSPPDPPPRDLSLSFGGRVGH